MRVCQFHHFGTSVQRTPPGGADQVRTDDPHNAIVVLYQLSYDPIQDDFTVRRKRIIVNLMSTESGVIKTFLFPKGK